MRRRSRSRSRSRHPEIDHSLIEAYKPKPPKYSADRNKSNINSPWDQRSTPRTPLHHQNRPNAPTNSDEQRRITPVQNRFNSQGMPATQRLIDPRLVRGQYSTSGREVPSTRRPTDQRNSFDHPETPVAGQRTTISMQHLNREPRSQMHQAQQSPSNGNLKDSRSYSWAQSPPMRQSQTPMNICRPNNNQSHLASSLPQQQRSIGGASFNTSASSGISRPINNCRPNNNQSNFASSLPQQQRSTSGAIFNPSATSGSSRTTTAPSMVTNHRQNQHQQQRGVMAHQPDGQQQQQIRRQQNMPSEPSILTEVVSAIPLGIFAPDDEDEEEQQQYGNGNAVGRNGSSGTSSPWPLQNQHQQQSVVVPARRRAIHSEDEDEDDENSQQQGCGTGAHMKPKTKRERIEQDNNNMSGPSTSAVTAAVPPAAAVVTSQDWEQAQTMLAREIPNNFALLNEKKQKCDDFLCEFAITINHFLGYG